MPSPSSTPRPSFHERTSCFRDGAWLSATSGVSGSSSTAGVLSTDRARTYKPDPRAYRLGIEGFGLRREEILLEAHAGWDAAGAKSFGYPTFWVNRPSTV